jgi:hypothetical protein
MVIKLQRLVILFSSLTVSLNGKSISLHKNKYHYEAYLETVLNYGSDASQTHSLRIFGVLMHLQEIDRLKPTSETRVMQSI